MVENFMYTYTINCRFCSHFSSKQKTGCQRVSPTWTYHHYVINTTSENHGRIYIILLKSLNAVSVFCHLRLKEEKMKLQQNLMVQFLLKQGQVELDSTEVPDYSDAVLINRSVVEELNCTLAVIHIIWKKFKLFKQMYCPSGALLFLQFDI